MTQYNEAALTATLKSSGDFDSAWLVVRADSPVEMQSMLDSLTTNGFGAVLAKADQAFKGSFQVGAQLGGEPVNAPTNPQQSHSAPAPQAPAQEQQNPWGQPATQEPTQQNPWGQSQPAAQQYAAGNFDGAGEPPLVLGMPARKVTGTNKKTGKPWAAWADPRPREATQHIEERTKDENDPRLAQGAVTFWRFID